MRAIGRAASVVAALALAGCGSEARLQRLEISPEVTAVTEHLRAQVTATAIWDDGTRRDVTAEAGWASQDPSLAAVDAGLVQAGPAAGTYLAAPSSTNLTASWSGLQASARVEVQPATLRSLEVTVDGQLVESATLALGLTRRLRVLGSYSDDSIRDVTAQVTWSDDHDDDDPVQVDLEGHLRTEAAAVVTLRASLDGVIHDLALQVTAAEPTALALVGLEDPLPEGDEVHLHVLAWLTDGSSVDVTGAAALWVVDGAVAQLDDDELEARRAGTTEVRATWLGLEVAVTLRVTAAVLRAVEVVPPATPLVVSALAYLAARGTYSDDATRDVTGEVAWSAEPAVMVQFYPELRRGCLLPKYAGAVTIVARHEAAGLEGRRALLISPRP